MRRRWILPALFLGLGLGLLGLARQTAGADEKADNVAKLIKQLDSARFADRERAARELADLGASALPALKKAADSNNLEIRRRSRELVEQIGTASLLAPKRVRLKFKDTLVIDAVDELARQSGYNIQIQGDPAGLVKRKVTFDTGETSFWQAFDQLCKKADLVEIPSAPVAQPGNPGLRPFQLQPFNPRLRGKRGQLQLQLPQFALGGGGLQPPRFGGMDGAQKPGGPMPFQFPQFPGDDPELQKIQQQLQQQLEQIMQMLQQQMQQMQQQMQKGRPGQPGLPGFPGQPGMQPGLQGQQQLMRQLLQQLQAVRQIRQPGLPGMLDRGADPQEPETRQINVRDGKFEQVPTFYAGAVRLRLLPTAEVGQRQGGEAVMVVDVSVEPKVYSFMVLDGSRVEKAVDEKGQAVDVALASGFAPIARGQRVPTSRQTLVRVKLGEKAPRELRELKGQLSGQVMAQSDPLIVVNDIFNAGGKTTRGDKGGSIEVFAVEKKGDGEVQIQLRLESPPLQAGGIQPASVPTLLDAKGESYQLLQIPARGRRTNGRVITQELTLLYRANPGQGDPTKLVLNGVRPVAVQVPFALQNVPLSR